MPHRPRLARLLLLASPLCLSLVGCVERTISITSEPTGALVYLNDEEVGRTPLTVPFTYYGVYDVRMQREGYQPLWTKQRADAPWWENPGPDLIAEAIPGVEAEQHWHFRLDPAPQPDADAVVDRAMQLRSTLGPR